MANLNLKGSTFFLIHPVRPLICIYLPPNKRQSHNYNIIVLFSHSDNSGVCVGGGGATVRQRCELFARVNWGPSDLSARLTQGC